MPNDQMTLDMFAAEHYRAADAGDKVSASSARLTVSGERAAIPAKPVKAIEDAGQELLANRRNRIKTALRWADVAGMNAALKVKEVVKGNVWPRPDYQQLIDGGLLPVHAHLVKQVYDSIAAKPAVGLGRVLDDNTLQRYMQGIQRVEAGVLEWLSDPDANQAWGLPGETGRKLLNLVYPQGTKEHIVELRLIGGNKLLDALQPDRNGLKKAGAAIKEGWPRKREAWEIQGYEILENPQIEVSPGSRGSTVVLVGNRMLGVYDDADQAQAAAATVQPMVLVHKRGIISSHADRAEAVVAAKELTQRSKERAVDDLGTNVLDVERAGPSRRLEGEDISSERLMGEFGLKGVNFGNWMKTPAARREAQMHLNYAFDSLHDLAEILGVPPKALSLNGMLGLAIGAQGSGGSAAAHFVPGVNEINLTRKTGAGSLGHEWAHALDHYFATQAGLSRAAEPFLTEHAGLGATRTTTELVDGRHTNVEKPRFAELRPEVLASFKMVVDAMDKRPQSPEEAHQAATEAVAKAHKGMMSWLRGIRRDFAGSEEAFDALSQRIQDGKLGDGHIALSDSAYVAPVLVEMRELYKATTGRMYSLDNIKGLQSNIGAWQHRLEALDQIGAAAQRNVKSEYARSASELDEKKGGKPYWSTKLEKFARAFDAFVSDSLEEKAARNSYLSHTGRSGPTVPMGTERAAINKAFRHMVSEFEVREVNNGPALFSTAGEDAGMPLAADVVDAELERIAMQWPGMPKVHVVQSPKDLPFPSPAHADGAYFDGHVYVVRSNIESIKQLQKVMAHECILHHGLEDMLGHYGFAKLHNGIQTLKKQGDATVLGLAKEIESRYGKLPPEIETREIVARAGEQCLDNDGNVKVAFGFMKGVFAGMVDWMRDHGLSVPFSNVELQGIMHNAGQWVSKAHSHNAERANEQSKTGRFIGRIVGVADGVVTQRIGRDNTTVTHALASLSKRVQVGEVVDIKFRNGVGHVDAGPSRGLSR